MKTIGLTDGNCLFSECINILFNRDAKVFFFSSHHKKQLKCFSINKSLASHFCCTYLLPKLFSSAEEYLLPPPMRGYSLPCCVMFTVIFSFYLRLGVRKLCLTWRLAQGRSQQQHTRTSLMVVKAACRLFSTETSKVPNTPDSDR